MREARVVVLPGDGIGPEVTREAVRIVEAACAGELSISWEHHVVGGAAIDEFGVPLPDGVLDACAASDAVLLGAVGGPKWDTTDPAAPRPEQALLALRKGLGLFANLRPVRPSPALYDASPLRRERIEGTDLLLIRELTGGIYFGAAGRDGDSAFDTCSYSREEIRRVVRLGFEAARDRRNRLTSVDKANVLETSRLWREEVNSLAPSYPEVAVDHLLVDNAAMQLVARPAEFDVIVTENMFGDILSDEAAMITGSIGLLPSASVGGSGPGLYEPIHGSAPDIAGKGWANPVATALSGALMLRHSLDAEGPAARIEAAVESVLASGHRSRDLGGTLGTTDMGDLVVAALA